ncbi:MarR family [Moorena producens 3L]|uniref:MarR family n=1 Tax=Moorena producens 3L TaxID=489825 RepID=F4XRD1_9CYAN|nr:MarR family transcriptional regulator [Moorena producens]EGJ32850.1 MarR family [Moorena producens 3L]OLT55778.1 MarR family transcriptional regulator [Moorena producens 3L]
MANKALITESPDLTTEQKVMALLSCLAQEQKARMDRLLREERLSVLQLQILHVLSKAPEGRLTVNQLRSFLVDDSPNVSRTLNKLVEMRLVTKERSAEDQRTVFVTITKDGEAAHVSADERLLEMSTGLSERELEQLYRLLKKL